MLTNKNKELIVIKSFKKGLFYLLTLTLIMALVPSLQVGAATEGVAVSNNNKVVLTNMPGFPGDETFLYADLSSPHNDTIRAYVYTPEKDIYEIEDTDLFIVQDSNNKHVFRATDYDYFFSEIYSLVNSYDGFAWIDENSAGYNTYGYNIVSNIGYTVDEYGFPIPYNISFDIFTVVEMEKSSNVFYYNIETNTYQKANDNIVVSAKVGFFFDMVNKYIYYNFLTSDGEWIEKYILIDEYIDTNTNDIPLSLVYIPDEDLVSGEQYYNQGYQAGYLVGEADGYNRGIREGSGGSWGMIWSAFLSIFSILSIEIFDGVTLGMFAMIPLVFGLLAFILNLGKKGDD